MDDRATHRSKTKLASQIFLEDCPPLLETTISKRALKPCVLQKLMHTLPVCASATSELPTPKRPDPQSKS
ncbi:MAG: hypothetical protein GY820_34765 [Gammaproteobacteria bacterium]|nr:hypothetical protein [Gammaproteobacteria bacterium]